MDKMPTDLPHLYIQSTDHTSSVTSICGVENLSLFKDVFPWFNPVLLKPNKVPEWYCLDCLNHPDYALKLLAEYG